MKIKAPLFYRSTNDLSDDAVIGNAKAELCFLAPLMHHLDVRIAKKMDSWISANKTTLAYEQADQHSDESVRKLYMLFNQARLVMLRPQNWYNRIPEGLAETVHTEWGGWSAYADSKTVGSHWVRTFAPIFVDLHKLRGRRSYAKLLRINAKKAVLKAA